jgi:sulfoxide reductase heme-binding subunit YedZ
MTKKRITWLQVIVHIGGWTPLAILVYDFFTHHLTANPIQFIEQETGIHALTFLLYSLACTPLSSILGWHELTQRRKALGNYAFLYASLHVTTFFWLDYNLDLLAIWRDVGTKWYIIIGLTAFLLLLPLAFTSFNYWMKRMGKDWKRLHKLVYFISPLVGIHFLLAVKGDLFRLSGNISQPVLYEGIALLLLILRIHPVKIALIGLRTRIVLLFRKVKPAEKPKPPAVEPPLEEATGGQ